MMKKKNVLGIDIDNYTVRESMLKVDNYLNNTVLNTMQIITMETLVQASEINIVKECIEMLDLSIIGDKEILSVIGIESAYRYKEISDDQFLHEFLKKVAKYKKSLYVLAADKETLTSFEQLLIDKFSNVKYVGSQVYDNENTDSATVVNEINSVMPDVIISLLKTPDQEEFIMENKSMLSSTVWLGIGENIYNAEENENVISKAKKYFYKKILHQRVRDYENNGEK